MASDFYAQTVTIWITGERLSWETRGQPWETTVSADVTELNFTNQSLYLGDNQLTALDLPDELPNLKRLDLSFNQLTALNLPDELPGLWSFQLRDNQRTDLVLPTKISGLRRLGVRNNPLQSLAAPAEADLNLDWLGTFRGFAKERVIYYRPDSLLPDIGLQAAVRAALEKGNGEAITAEELAGLTALNARWTEELSRPKIQSLAGLEGAVNLETLDLRSNGLTALTLPSEWTGLRELNLTGNGLMALTLPSEWTQLETLSLGNNGLTELALPAAWTGLRELNLTGNGLTELALPAGWTKLETLNLGGNALTELILPTGLASLAALNLTGSQVKQVAVPLDFNLGGLRLSGYSKAAVVFYDPVVPVGRVAIKRLAEGGVSIRWSGGILQSTEEVDGIWEEVGGVSSPLRIQEPQVRAISARFFRLRPE